MLVAPLSVTFQRAIFERLAGRHVQKKILKNCMTVPIVERCIQTAIENGNLECQRQRLNAVTVSNDFVCIMRATVAIGKHSHAKLVFLVILSCVIHVLHGQRPMCVGALAVHVGRSLHRFCKLVLGHALQNSKVSVQLTNGKHAVKIQIGKIPMVIAQEQVFGHLVGNSLRHLGSPDKRTTECKLGNRGTDIPDSKGDQTSRDD